MTQSAIPTTYRMNPPRIWAESRYPSKVTNLFPASYVNDPTNIQRSLLSTLSLLAIERRCLHRALKARDTPCIRSYRRSIDRLEAYARNCRTRLAQLS